MVRGLSSRLFLARCTLSTAAATDAAATIAAAAAIPVTAAAAAVTFCGKRQLTHFSLFILSVVDSLPLLSFSLCYPFAPSASSSSPVCVLTRLFDATTPVIFLLI
jgi:hypothetical protein